MSSPAFLLIQAQITHPKQFQQYADAVYRLTQQFGGRYRVLGGEQVCLEGPAPEGWRVVISEWPSKDAALVFWHSPEYAAIKPLRSDAAEVIIQLFDGQPGDV
ncbi:MAG: DUF1330 domain-containing protein [Cyanobacteria bacterium P01_G01_bin.54]